MLSSSIITEGTMAEPTGSTRWWENYLVRYFLPSLVGMLIVLWLQKNAGNSAYIPRILPRDPRDFNTGHLLLLLLLGSLYSYIASYPALVFHATRVLDFKDVIGRPAEWPYVLLNPYLVSALFVAATGLCALYDLRQAAFTAVVVFSIIQIIRILLVSLSFGDFGLKRNVGAVFAANISYAYLRMLSQRRGKTTTEKIEPTAEKKARGVKESLVTRKDEKDFVDSYRHLREHGNTAFIVFLELALCPVLYLLLEFQDGAANKVWFGSLLAIWVFPSVLIHGLAQQLERRYSWFRYSVKRRGERQRENAAR